MSKNLARSSALREKLRKLYATDEVAWLERSAQLIRQKELRKLDYEHLAEYLNDMARRDRREVKSRLVSLLVHLLKWEFQPRKRTGSWKASILHQRGELKDEFAGSKTLKNHAAAVLGEAYLRASSLAAAETGPPSSTFSKDCPYSLEFLIGDEFPAGDEA